MLTRARRAALSFQAKMYSFLYAFLYHNKVNKSIKSKQQVLKMQRSMAPSRRGGGNQRARRQQRDREYRPGRTNIVDDFAVIPQIPEGRFRPHIPMSAGAYINLSDPNRARPMYEYEVADVPDVQLDNVRPTTPPGGFHGYLIGMRRCQDCRSWIYPPRMTDHRCPHCFEVANKVNEVNNQVNTINKQ